MHDGNYDPNDERCIQHKHLIEELEERRKRYEERQDSKFYSRTDELRFALDDIYRHFKVDIGYAPAWLINALEDRINKAGRPAQYSTDDRFLFSQLIDLLKDYRSSKAQAINLIGVMYGYQHVTDGFIKELRDTYNEYIDYGYKEKHNTITEKGVTIARASNLGLDQVENTTENIHKATNALTQICEELIKHMQDNHKLVRDKDSAHEKEHSLIIPILEKPDDNPLKNFFCEEKKIEGMVHEFRRQMYDYLHTIELFRGEKNLPA